jgi:hypothetical protein
MREAVQICERLPGAVSIAELFEMEWPTYELLIKILREPRRESGE